MVLAISGVVTTAARGKPFPMPLAIVTAIYMNPIKCHACETQILMLHKRDSLPNRSHLFPDSKVVEGVWLGACLPMSGSTP